MDAKKEVKIALFITEKMDDQLEQMACLMGITKHEYIRFCIAQSTLGYKTSIEFIQKKLSQLKAEEMFK